MPPVVLVVPTHSVPAAYLLLLVAASTESLVADVPQLSRQQCPASISLAAGYHCRGITFLLMQHLQCAVPARLTLPASHSPPGPL